MARLFIEFLHDLRYGARLLFRNKLFSLVATLSLAIGIGGAASVFTLLNAVVYRTLPVPEPQRLFTAAVKGPTGDPNPRMSWPAFQEASDALKGRADLCATTRGTGMQLREAGADTGPAARGFVQLVSGECFDVMRQRPQIGRLLTPADNVTLDAHPVAVISDAFWERQYRRNASVVGSQLLINGTSFTIVGVAGPGYFGPYVALRDPDAWVPLVMQHTVRHASNADNSGESDPRKPWAAQATIQWLEVFGRLAPGESADGVSAVLTTRYRREAAAGLDPSNTDGRASIDATNVIVSPAARGVSRMRDQLDTTLWVLLAMVCVLVAIASGNVASLLLARAGAREREIAIRLSIGAGRLRLVRQLLAETLLLSAIGGFLGLLVAAWGREALLLMYSRGATIVDFDTSFDWRVIVFVVGVTALSGLATGLLPALRGTRVALVESLKQNARTVGTEGGRRGVLIGKMLVASQIAFCLLLLVVSGLFIRSLTSLLQVDVGYDRGRLLTASLDIRSLGYTPAARQGLYVRLVDRVKAIPGVESASLSANGPFAGSQRISSLSVEGYTPGPDEPLRTNEETVTEDYFDTVGLRIVEGRGFLPEDRQPERRSTVISESMARRYFSGRSAVGRRWSYGDPPGADSPIVVGIVEDARYVDLRGTQPTMAYHLAAASEADILSSLQVRTRLRPAELTGAVRQTLNDVDPGLPIVEIVPFEDRLDRGVANERMVAQLTTTFGVIALLLACLGLYGTISYGVNRRVSELGVRMALGAERTHVLWIVLREALVLVAVGAMLGVPLAYLTGRGIGSFLYNVAPADPAVYAVGTAVLLAAATVAALLPALRASRIDPMVALRKE